MSKQLTWLAAITVSASMVLLFQNCSGSEFTTLGSTGLQAQTSSTPPTLVISEAPPALSKLRSFDFKFSTNTSSGVNIQSITCSLDSGPAKECTNGFTALDLLDGDHVLKVKAKDSLGNSSDEIVYLWKIDATKPIVTFNQTPAAVTGVTSVSFAFSGNETASFLCAMNAETMAPCSSPVTRALPEGAHTFKVQAIDNAGNASDSVISSFKVDLTAPALNILTKPMALNGARTASFTFSGTDDGMAISVFSCKLDNQAAAACNAGSVNYTNLPEGSHTFALSGQDTAGNLSTAITYTWSIDLTAPTTPVITADVPASTNNTAATFLFSSTDLNGVKSFECQIDAGAFSACTSPKTYSGLSIANHTFAVRSRDQVDNLSAAASFAWTITAPPTPTPTPAPTATPTPTPPPTDPTDFYAKIASGTWVKVSSSAGIAPPNGIAAYSGMAIDDRNGQILLFGGGHGDYSGNEVWAWKMSTFTWRKMYEPDLLSGISLAACQAGVDNANYPGMWKPSGRPISRHTYDAVEYISHLGVMMAGGASTYSGPNDFLWDTNSNGPGCYFNSPKDLWFYNADTAAWTYKGSAVLDNTRIGVGTSAYDSTTGNVVVLGRTAGYELSTHIYNPNTNTFMQKFPTANAPWQGEISATYDSKRHYVLFYGGDYPASDKLQAYSVDQNTWMDISPASGARPAAGGGAGVSYDSAADVIIVHGSGGSWVYDYASKTWSQTKTTGPRGSSQIHGKLKYDKQRNVTFLVYVGAESKIEVWAYRHK